MAVSPALAAFDKAGPLTTKGYSEGRGCTIFRPETLTGKSPIVLWGNGTGVTPAGYAGMLNQLASHGFVVAAADTTNAGTAIEMLECLKYLTEESSRAGSRYEGKLDIAKVGASGHSQGGGGSIMAGRDERVKTTAPIQPYTLRLGYVAGAQAQQHGPMLLLSGGADTIARPEPNQKPVFDETNVREPFRSNAGRFRILPAGAHCLVPLSADGRPRRRGPVHRCGLRPVHRAGLDHPAQERGLGAASAAMIALQAPVRTPCAGARAKA